VPEVSTRSKTKTFLAQHQ